MEGARRAAATALASAVLLVAACGTEEPRLATVPHLALRGHPAETLHLDRAGRAWVGAAGEMRIFPAPGGARARLIHLRLDGTAAPEVVAQGDGTLYLRMDDRLSALRMEPLRESGTREISGESPILLDVRGRFVAQGAASGAVLAYEPQTLEPEWSWAARGAATTALAASPAGDLVWQALEAPETGAVLLERDLQTGRILDEHDLPDPILCLATTPGGDIIAVSGAGDRLHALRLRPRGTELTTVWRVALAMGGEGPPEVRYAPDARLVAVFRPGSEAGLRVLDAEAGHLIGSVEETPLDAAFSAQGGLFVLTADEVREVVLPGRTHPQ